MPTLTMQGVADLARVRRPVVSMWRTRFAAGDEAFPAPVDDHPLQFDADQIGKWLRDTGHGKNEDAGVESPLHSPQRRDLLDHLSDASALALVHQLTGQPLGETDPREVVDLIAAHALDVALSPQDLNAALGADEVREGVDRLAEAAFSGAGALVSLVDMLVERGGPLAGEALTTAGSQLLARILADIVGSDERRVVPVSDGALLIVESMTRRRGEDFTARVGCLEWPDEPYQQALWRALVAGGCSVEQEHSQLADCPRLRLLQQQAVEDQVAFADMIEEHLVELASDDLLMVVGPARLLTDRAGAVFRRRLLTPSETHCEPLRYAARLPKGLSRFGGRRRLALWVLGKSDSTWTVVGEHSDATLTEVAVSALAADVAASVADAVDVNAHAFSSSAVVDTATLLRRPELRVPPRRVDLVAGGERLARIWDLDPGLLTGIELAAADGTPRETTFRAALRELGEDRRGTRLPEGLVGRVEPGYVVVVGPDEVRDPARVGSRGIDRLVLEDEVPRARLTRPGDVVYVGSGGPAAWVDADGGHVVEAPARIFRCLDVESEDRQLVPHVVAADVAAQTGSDRTSWQLRTVPVDNVAGLEGALQRTATRRRQLLEELAALNDLDSELIKGLSAGSLSATMTPSNATKEL